MSGVIVKSDAGCIRYVLSILTDASLLSRPFSLIVCWLDRLQVREGFYANGGVWEWLVRRAGAGV
jgi:hypothetical protein